MRHEIEPQKQDTKAEQDVGGIAGFVLLAEHHRGCEGDGNQGKGGDVDLKAQEGNQPSGEGGADVGSQDDPDRLGEAHQTCVDKTDHHDGGCR